MAELKVRSNLPPFTPIKNSLIDSENVLNEHEKILYIVLLRYGDKAFPSLATLSKKCGFSKRTAQRTIDSLIEKGLLKKRKRKNKKNGNTSNQYILLDDDKIWLSSVDNMQDAIDAAELERAIKLVENAGMTISGKEKGLESEPTKAHNQAPQNSISNYSTDEIKNQSERYTLDQIRQIYNYDVMIHDNPEWQQDIDVVIQILYDVLNTIKQTIRVSGEDKPAMIVIAKLMKLTFQGITYAIRQYKKQTGRVKNPTGYMLTLLYNAEEQMHLDITNKVTHDMNT